MLTGTLFLVAIAAAVLVVLWSIANDHAGDDGETGGLFKMQVAAAADGLAEPVRPSGAGGSGGRPRQTDERPGRSA